MILNFQFHQFLQFLQGDQKSFLQDSLGGNARTMMIACISPSNTNFEETLSTLKYAHTTKSVNNRPTMNVENDPKDQLIRELQNEIKNLRHRLDYRQLDTA